MPVMPSTRARRRKRRCAPHGARHSRADSVVRTQIRLQHGPVCSRPYPSGSAAFRQIGGAARVLARGSSCVRATIPFGCSALADISAPSHQGTLGLNELAFQVGKLCLVNHAILGRLRNSRRDIADFLHHSDNSGGRIAKAFVNRGHGDGDQAVPPAKRLDRQRCVVHTGFVAQLDDQRQILVGDVMGVNARPQLVAQHSDCGAFALAAAERFRKACDPTWVLAGKGVERLMLIGVRVFVRHGKPPVIWPSQGIAPSLTLCSNAALQSRKLREKSVFQPKPLPALFDAERCAELSLALLSNACHETVRPPWISQTPSSSASAVIKRSIFSSVSARG